MAASSRRVEESIDVQTGKEVSSTLEPNGSVLLPATLGGKSQKQQKDHAPHR
jgi:hypothetical protein